jgi:hypothetical protein
MVRPVTNSRRKEISQTISVSGSTNEVGQKKQFRGIIHGKTGQELTQIIFIHDSITTWRKDP